MNTRISKGAAWGTVCAPPSKSYAHRIMICAALASGTSVIHGITQSEDMLATLDCIKALGARASLAGNTLTVTGAAVPGSPVFPCRESGSTLRFLLPVALAKNRQACFTGTARLMERGIGIYETLFAQKGISVLKTGEAVTVKGTLSPGEYVIRGDVSSQFVSGLLFALPLLPGSSTLQVLSPVESRPYIDITLQVLESFGVKVSEISENRFLVPGGSVYRGTEIPVEGDWSNAAALLALRSFGQAVQVSGLDPTSLQGDRICTDYFRRLESPGAILDISGCPDLGPILFAVAAAKHGAIFTGTRRLRIKESDRASAMAEELASFGARVTVAENTVTVAPGGIRKPVGRLHGHNDHRVVMALAVLATLTGAEIDGTEAVRKSYPGFFETLRQLHLEVTHEI